MGDPMYYCGPTKTKRTRTRKKYNFSHGLNSLAGPEAENCSKSRVILETSKSLQEFR